MNILSAINKSQYDAMTVMLERRLPRATLQAHYTLASAKAYGGVSTGTRRRPGARLGRRSRPGGSVGPTGSDERHRVVATGVFDLAWGIQLSPVVQLASARPYNLTAGTDLNADGNNNDRYIDPATGKQVSYNAARAIRRTSSTSGRRSSSTSEAEATGNSASSSRPSICSTRRTSAAATRATPGARLSGSPPGSCRHRLPATGPARRAIPVLART